MASIYASVVGTMCVCECCAYSNDGRFPCVITGEYREKGIKSKKNELCRNSFVIKSMFFVTFFIFFCCYFFVILLNFFSFFEITSYFVPFCPILSQFLHSSIVFSHFPWMLPMFFQQITIFRVLSPIFSEILSLLSTFSAILFIFHDFSSHIVHISWHLLIINRRFCLNMSN